MDEFQWLWMYQSWLQDLEDRHDFYRSYAILNGAFSNAEMAQRMIKNDNPDFEMSDEDMEKVSQQIIQTHKHSPTTTPKRKRRRVIESR